MRSSQLLKKTVFRMMMSRGKFSWRFLVAFLRQEKQIKEIIFYDFMDVFVTFISKGDQSCRASCFYAQLFGRSYYANIPTLL